MLNELYFRFGFAHGIQGKEGEIYPISKDFINGSLFRRFNRQFQKT